MPVTHTIEIKRQDDDPTKPLVFDHKDSAGGDIGELISTDSFRVRPGDKIRWTSKLGNFAILFKDDAPFNGDALSVAGAKDTISSARVAKKIGGTAAVPVQIVFEYGAVVWEGAKFSAVDPLMEIDDGGGGTL
jgi:hypothetical protein